MTRCNHCRRDVDPSLTICPNCRSELAVEAEGPWVSIARLTNLAEAGFFADLLAHEQIGTRLRQHDRFSAVDGTWMPEYLMQVPEQHAEHAALWIQHNLERTGTDEPVAEGAAAEPDSHMAAWKPLVLVLMAGGLFYWAGQAMVDARVPRDVPPRGPALWRVLTELDEPLVSPARGHRPRYRLQPGPDGDRIFLDEDRDGDGRFTRYEFHHGRLVTGPVMP